MQANSLLHIPVQGFIPTFEESMIAGENWKYFSNMKFQTAFGVLKSLGVDSIEKSSTLLWRWGIEELFHLYLLFCVLKAKAI